MFLNKIIVEFRINQNNLSILFASNSCLICNLAESSNLKVKLCIASSLSVLIVYEAQMYH